MALTKLEKAQIKGLMRERGWSALLKFTAEKLNQWKGQAIEGSNAFETLRAMHIRDGKVAGVNELFEQMEIAASE